MGQNCKIAIHGNKRQLPFLNNKQFTMQKDIYKDNATIESQARFENVAAALYLVTNHLPDGESLKHKIRQVAQIVLEEFITLGDLSTATIFDRLGHIRSLLKIASVASMISKQNVGVIDGEILAIQSSIKDLQNREASLSVSIGKVLMLDFVGESFLDNVDQNTNHDISTDIAKSNNMIGPGSKPVSLQTQFSPRQITGSNDRSAAFNSSKEKTADSHRENTRAQDRSQKNTVSNPGHAQVSGAPVAKFPQNRSAQSNQLAAQSNGNNFAMVTSGNQINSIKKQTISTGVTPRQNIIINEIKNKGQLTIRDLVGKIEGCSEKTVQRELLALVDSGVLKKEGERRWSKYSVN